jgi:hypothetical protein
LGGTSLIPDGTAVFHVGGQVFGTAKIYTLSGDVRTMGWTRRRKIRTVVLAGVVTAIVVTILVLLWVPISEEQSGYTMIGFKLYSYETVDPFTSPTSSFTYRGVLFDFQALPPSDCPQNAGGGNICAAVTESSGVTFWFNVSFGPPCHSFGTWFTWVSPDQHEAVEIETCAGTTPFHLLVAA